MDRLAVNQSTRRDATEPEDTRTRLPRGRQLFVNFYGFVFNASSLGRRQTAKAVNAGSGSGSGPGPCSGAQGSLVEGQEVGQGLRCTAGIAFHGVGRHAVMASDGVTLEGKERLCEALGYSCC